MKNWCIKSRFSKLQKCWVHFLHIYGCHDKWMMMGELKMSWDISDLKKHIYACWGFAFQIILNSHRQYQTCNSRGNKNFKREMYCSPHFSELVAENRQECWFLATTHDNSCLNKNCRVSWLVAWHIRSPVTVSGLGSNRNKLNWNIQSNLIHLAAQALIKKRNGPGQDSLMPVVRPHVGLSFSSLLPSTDQIN